MYNVQNTTIVTLTIVIFSTIGSTLKEIKLVQRRNSMTIVTNNCQVFIIKFKQFNFSPAFWVYIMK